MSNKCLGKKTFYIFIFIDFLTLSPPANLLLLQASWNVQSIRALNRRGEPQAYNANAMFQGHDNLNAKVMATSVNVMGPSGETIKMEVPCNKCGMLKNILCSMAVSAEHSSKSKF